MFKWLLSRVFQEDLLPETEIKLKNHKSHIKSNKIYATKQINKKNYKKKYTDLTREEHGGGGEEEAQERNEPC